MVLEVADIRVRPGTADEFVAAFHGIKHVLTTTPGCRSVRMTHCVESPERFVLLVEWDDIAAHDDNFRSTERFAQWRGAIGPFFAQPPLVEHCEDVTQD